MSKLYSAIAQPRLGVFALSSYDWQVGRPLRNVAIMIIDGADVNKVTKDFCYVFDRTWVVPSDILVTIKVDKSPGFLQFT
jgi:hypothetical protein